MATTQPRTLLEAVVYFSDPAKAFDFVKQLRWPTGEPVCPRCGCLEHSFLTTRRIWKCKGCKRQFSIKVGTIFEDSPIGFDKWLSAMWLISNSKNSISSYEVARALGITQKTAWFMLHRIRLAMESKTFERLSGAVEMDETYFGGKPRLSDKREFSAAPNPQAAAIAWSHAKKTAVFGMVERNTTEVVNGKPRIIEHGQVVAYTVPQKMQTAIVDHIGNHVVPTTTIYADDARVYDRLAGDGWEHHTITHSQGTYVNGAIHTQQIEGFWAILKRAIQGTQIHVSRQQLGRYVAERAFAYNYRDESDLVRMRTAVTGTAGRRLTYAALISR